MKWIKLWTEETVRGTTFVELDAASRGIWFSFLALAGIDGSGIIQAGINRGYPIELLAHLINVQNDELKEAVTKLVTFKKIKLLEHGEIEIINWTKYQDEYHRQKPYRITKQKIKEKQQGLQEQLQPKLQEKLQQRLSADKDKEEDKDVKTKHITAKTASQIALRDIVNCYKTETGNDINDKAWDKAYFKRCLASSKKLLEFLGSSEVACECIRACHKWAAENKLYWTLETVLKKAADFKNGKLGHNNTITKEPIVKSTREEKIKYAIDLELASIRTFHKDWNPEKVTEYMEAFKIKAEKGIPQEALQSE